MIFKFSKSGNLFKVFKNSSWLLLEYTLKLIGGYFVSIWLARALGPEQFGVFNFAIAIVTIFTAISYSGLQGIAIKALVEDRESEEENIGTIFYIKLVASIICLVVMVIVLVILDVDELKFILTLLVGLKLIFSSFNVIDLYFESHVMSKYKVIGRNAAYLLRLLLTVVFIYSGASLMWLGGVLILEEVAGITLIAYFFLKKSNILLTNCKFNYKKAKDYLLQAWPLIFASVGAILYFKIDQIMVVDMVGDAEGGIYAAAVRLTELFYFIPTLLITSLFPILIQMRKENEAKYIYRLKQLIFVLGFAALLISLAIYSFAGELINFTFGVEFSSAADIIRIYIWSLVFTFIGQVLSRWLIIEDLTTFSLVRHLLGLLTNVFLNYLLIPKYGGKGAAIASLISLFMANVAFLIFSKRTLFFLKLLISSIIPLKIKNFE